MVPALSEGTVVVVIKTWFFCRVFKGDVIVFRDPRTHARVIKRIIDIRNNAYFVQGDNSQESTDSRTYGWILKKYVIGKVLHHLN